MTGIDSKRRRVWFITGTSSGVGYAVARAALEHGDFVTAAARNTSAIEELVALREKDLDDRFPGLLDSVVTAHEAAPR
jgi:NAD(P)-dependent dehydrogenase (short-subunit alcohol dehydrogenase family)